MGAWETAFFYLFAAGALVSSLAVVVYRNPLYSAIALILDFFFFAGLYGLLSAHFMAVTQILVYGGAIMVLFVFIIMLLNLREDELGEANFRAHHVLAVVGGLAMMLFALSAFGPLVGRDDVAQQRAEFDTALEAAEAAAELDDDVELEEPPLAVRSEIPGLFVDLNEPALLEAWDARIAGWASGELSPADGKYPRFDDTQPIVVPPVLLREADVTPEAPPRSDTVSFGTVEPISVLLVNRFVIPFELTALLLLAAIVGAVIIAKKRL